MKLQFKKQSYQTASVEAIVDCFAGQPKAAGIQYRVDPGRRLEARLQQEKQFNRKVELNRELRTLRNELSSLSRLSEDKELDTSWTN